VDDLRQVSEHESCYSAPAEGDQKCDYDVTTLTVMIAIECEDSAGAHQSQPRC
jgi:hypothetical protein